MVETLLIINARLRDDDNMLIAAAWGRELVMNGYDHENMSALDFLTLFADGKLSSPESIRRTRQKIQQCDESLRGAKYKERHKHQTQVVDELHEIENTYK